MSIEVTWPQQQSTATKMAIDCLKNLFSPDGVKQIMDMRDSDRRRIFEFIANSGHYVTPPLLS